MWQHAQASFTFHKGAIRRFTHAQTNRVAPGALQLSSHLMFSLLARN